MSRRALRIVLWITTAAWAGVIFYFSSLRSSKLPGRIPPEVGHFGVYAILGILLYLALAMDLGHRRALMWAVLGASLYGITDEFHQRFVVTRTPDVWDWAVDTAGALAGASLAWLIANAALRSRRVTKVASTP